MLLAQIRLAATEKLECRVGILRLIGGESLEPTTAWMEEKLDEQDDDSQEPSQEIEGGQEVDDEPEADSGTTALDQRAKDPFETYRKMLKVGVPRPTVEGLMRRDGVNPAGLDGPLPEGDIYIQHDLEPVVRDFPVARTTRRKWHWNEEPEADRGQPALDGSIWTQVNKKDAPQRVSDLSQVHIRASCVREIGSANPEHETAASTMADAGMALTVQRPPRSGNVEVLTATKGVHLELAVKHIKLPFSDVAKDVNILTAIYLQDTDLKTILSMWPSIAEQIALDEYSGDFESLGLCEQFLVTIRTVPMAKEKLQCLLLKLERSSRVEELKQAVLLVTRALNQLCSSAKFTKAILLLRDFGNLVNEESVDQYRTRFSLQSLSNMAHTKAFDGSSTIFDGFVDVLRMEDNGELVSFYDEINLVLQCKSVSVDALTSEMRQLREGYHLARSIALASAPSGDAPDKLALQAFTQFAEEFDDDLCGVQTYFDNLDASKNVFVSWFEENVHRSLDKHLKAIIDFSLEVKARNANWPALRT